MRLVLSTLMHGRHLTVDRCIEANREAGIKDFVFSYTTEEDGRFLMPYGVKTIQAHNFIPSKAQASIYACYELNPDAIILMGSDDYINEKGYRLILELLKTHDYIAFEDCVFEHKGKHWLWGGYPATSGRNGEPAGAGKVIRRDLLDRLNWEVYTGSKERAEDYTAHTVLKRNSKRRTTIGTKDGAILIDVKDSGSTTPLKKFNYLTEFELPK